MKWRRMNDGEKIRSAFDVLSEIDLCKEGLKLSNFDKFVALMSHCIGGKQNQTNILQAQFKIQLLHFSLGNKSTPVQLLTLYKLCQAANAESVKISDRFWVVFGPQVERAFKEFNRPRCVHAIATSMNHLFAYAEFAKQVEWVHEFPVILKKACTLINKQAGILVNEFDRDDSVAPAELVVLYGELLLQANESFFYQNFGHLKILLEHRARSVSADAISDDPNSTEFDYDFEEGSMKLCGGDPLLLKLDDPNHFGHLVWKFGLIWKLLDGDNNNNN